MLRIADIIEVNPVHIVILNDFPHQRKKVVRRPLRTGIQIPFPAMPLAQIAVPTHNRGFSLFANVLIRAQGKGNKPSMAFHPAPMAFLYREGQRVVARRLPALSRQDFGKWLNDRTVKDIAPQADLEKDGIEVRLAQAVEYPAQVGLLHPAGIIVRRPIARPIQPINSCQPNGAYLFLGRHHVLRRARERYDNAYQ